MSKVTNAIRKSEETIRQLKEDIVEFTKLKEDYISGNRSMYEDYPRWNHPFHRTPMEWVDYRIRSATYELKREEEKLRELYKEQSWLDVKYYRMLDMVDINEVINRDGFIIGIKL